MLEKLYNALKYLWSLLGFNAKSKTEVFDLEKAILQMPEFDIKRIDTIPAVNINEDLFQLNLQRQATIYEPLTSIRGDIQFMNMPATLFPKSYQPTPLAPRVFNNPSAENGEQLAATLPVELWLNIFTKLPIPTLLKVMMACKYFGELTNEPKLRMAMAQEKYQRAQVEFFTSLNTFKLHPKDFAMENNDIYSEPGELGFILKGKR
ncbi:F-box protein [Legionella lytica]|uniref:F-box protein n=1 Tax=Legionella lytica TaxID=96232 RepID=A0ABW8D4V3_9GAMM